MQVAITILLIFFSLPTERRKNGATLLGRCAASIVSPTSEPVDRGRFQRCRCFPSNPWLDDGAFGIVRVPSRHSRMHRPFQASFDSESRSANRRDLPHTGTAAERPVKTLVPRQSGRVNRFSLPY